MFQTKLLSLKYTREKNLDHTLEIGTLNNVGNILIPIKDSFLDRPWLSIALRVLILIAFLLLSIRLVLIQVYSAPVWQDWSENSTRQIVFLAPPRGQIYDRHGKLIASNRPTFSFVSSFKNIQNSDRKKSIMELFQLSDSDLDKILKKGYAGTVTIKKNLNNDEMLQYIAQATNLGVDVIAEYDRLYADPNLSPGDKEMVNQSISSVTGYVGFPTEANLERLDTSIYRPDSKIGVTGIEKIYEPQLQGKPGKIERQFQVQTDTEYKVVQNVESGQKIVTSLDLKVQLEMYKILAEELNNNQLKAGAAVLMNAETGEIRAMVNYPSFDPEAFTDSSKQKKLSNYFTDQNRPLFNRSIRGQYPPGSSIKPFVAAVAIEQGVIKPGQELYDPGVIRVESKVVKDRVDEYINYKRTFFGNLDISMALAKSSDIFFYYLAGGDPETGKVPILNSTPTNPIGINQLKESLEKYFGFGQRTGVDLELENKGTIPNPEYKQGLKLGSWFLGDTYQTSIGQGFVLATPVQMARATAVLANGGYLVQPHINTALKSENTSSGLSSNTLKVINDAMRAVVTEGTAKRLQDNRSEIAAKTGTAQFDPKDPDRSYGWVISYNRNQEVINEKLVLVVITEDIRKTAEYITVPTTNRMWQAVEQIYIDNRTSDAIR
ncbi:MAG: penicillin-binding protein 2 [Patescibacteria group bacterium]